MRHIGLSDSSQSLFILIIVVGILLSCDGLMEKEDEDDNSTETINTSSDRVSGHFPEFGETITSGIDSVTLDITDPNLINSNSLYCEIFRYPLSDSAWFTYESIRYRSGGEAGSKACFSEEYEILYTQRKPVDDGVYFKVTGGCQNQESHIQANYNYLVHIYDDENNVKFYWTFTRK